MRSTRWLNAALLLAACLVVDCTSSGSGTSNTGPGGSISLALSSSSASVAQGGSITVTGTLTRAGGFTGDVGLTLDAPAPAGVGGSVANVVTSGGTTTGTITITVAQTTTPGTYTLTVRGKGAGVSDALATFTLTVTAVAAPGFSLALTSSSASVPQGGNTVTTATVTRVGGFTGDVTTTFEGAPLGVTGAVSNVVTLAGVTTFAVTFSVAPTTTPGTYNVTVRDHNGGVPTDATALFALTVTQTTSSYTLALSPSTVSIAQNGNAAIQVNIGRTNYTGAVSLALSGAPTGVTGVFSPQPAPGNSSTLTITVGATATPGNYTMTVSGIAAAQSSSTGVASIVNQSATLTLTLTAAGSTQTVYWTYFAVPPTPGIDFAGLPLSSGTSPTSVPTGSSTLSSVSAVTFDASGRLWAINFPATGGIVADVFTLPITPASKPVLVFGLPSTGNIDHITFDAAGNLWASDFFNLLEYKFTPPFTTSRTLVPAVTLPLPGFTNPAGIASDAAGNVYVSDVGSPGTQSIAVFRAPVTNTSTPAFYLNGLVGPGGLIFDAQGNLYASSNPVGQPKSIVRYNSNNLVSGARPNIVNTLGPTGSYEAEFAFDAAGNLYVADCGNLNAGVGIRSYPIGTSPFSSTMVPSATYTNATINSIVCVWGIAIR